MSFRTSLDSVFRPIRLFVKKGSSPAPEKRKQRLENGLGHPQPVRWTVSPTTLSTPKSSEKSWVVCVTNAGGEEHSKATQDQAGCPPAPRVPFNPNKETKHHMAQVI